MVVEGSWVTLVLGGILMALIGYFFLRRDPIGQIARARKELPKSRHPWFWEMDVYRPRIFIVLGACMTVIGLIWGGVSLFQ